MTTATTYDVLIIGGGQAGLTLARHLLLDTDQNILLIDQRDELPAPHQKVGESTVQIAGYYFSKVLDLEEHLFDHHYMKYNLRFYWRSAGKNKNIEDYHQSYIRNFSNIASFQLNRNVFEGELLRLNEQNPRFEKQLGIRSLDVSLKEEGPHQISFRVKGQTHLVNATWVVDTTGRGKTLARRRQIVPQKAPIDHGAFFWWVDGRVDIEALTDASRKERRLRRDRNHTGHLPCWLATNHFCDEGMWFWVIPLQGRTSLGLVYDNRIINREEVFSVEKATAFVCERFPLFARDLPHRKVLDHGGYRSYAHDCSQTLSAAKWAVSGEAGRFSDPLYSPGGDLISIYNTLIVDAIQTEDPEELKSKCQLHEQLMRVIFQAYLPTYSVSYDALGDHETFSLKYTWELTTYFAIFVFPFINDLYADRRFVLGFMRLFTKLGVLNDSMQHFLSAFFQWKKRHESSDAGPVFFDFTNVCTLKRAAETFYDVGLTVGEAKRIQNEQVEGMRELARFMATYVASRVLGHPEALFNRDFVASFDIENLKFDPGAFRASYENCQNCSELQEWTLDAEALEGFRQASHPIENMIQREMAS